MVSDFPQYRSTESLLERSIVMGLRSLTVLAPAAIAVYGTFWAPHGQDGDGAVNASHVTGIGSTRAW